MSHEHQILQATTGKRFRNPTTRKWLRVPTSKHAGNCKCCPPCLGCVAVRPSLPSTVHIAYTVRYREWDADCNLVRDCTADFGIDIPLDTDTCGYHSTAFPFGVPPGFETAADPTPVACHLLSGEDDGAGALVNIPLALARTSPTEPASPFIDAPDINGNSITCGWYVFWSTTQYISLSSIDVPYGTYPGTMVLGASYGIGPGPPFCGYQYNIYNIVVS